MIVGDARFLLLRDIRLNLLSGLSFLSWVASIRIDRLSLVRFRMFL